VVSDDLHCRRGVGRPRTVYVSTGAASGVAQQPLEGAQILQSPGASIRRAAGGE
jgi:hypothetical protein